MIGQARTIREPEAELLNAEDAAQEAEQPNILFRKQLSSEQGVALQVPYQSCSTLSIALHGG